MELKASPRTIASLVLSVIGFVIGTFLSLIPGIESFNQGSVLWILYFTNAGIAFAIPTWFSWGTVKRIRFERYERQLPEEVRVVAIDDEADILRLISIKLTKEGI